RDRLQALVLAPEMQKRFRFFLILQDVCRQDPADKNRVVTARICGECFAFKDSNRIANQWEAGWSFEIKACRTFGILFGEQPDDVLLICREDADAKLAGFGERLQAAEPIIQTNQN